MEETEKIGFFKRIKIAIFNIEKYSIFVKEKFSKAFKYILILTAIISIITAIISTNQLSKEIIKLVDFIKSDDLPNFELKDGKLEAEKVLESYDKEYNSSLIINTNSEITSEQINDYEKKVQDNDYSLILLNDKIIYKFDKTLDFWNETTYNNVTSVLGIDSLNKDQLISYLSEDKINTGKAVLFLYAFLTIFLLDAIRLFETIVIIGVFGWFASLISKVKLSVSQSLSLAIYSSTLSIILYTIYTIVQAFSDFEIKYFEVMYMLIAYIYMVASIIIMKGNNNLTSDVVTVSGVVMKTPDLEKDKEENEKEDDDKSNDHDDKNNSSNDDKRKE